ncbi:MAG: DNA repair protein RecN [Fibrobacterota bacterium]|nr:DNA repair protein RecN [Fibrobacterota bacterium]QQS03910.1 MAG: DNA repair protein RecN [Fibrobacterota bacterium]
MLLELEIRDLAIFSLARAEFGPGLTCLTGETGAGKSVFLSALRLLQGARAETDLVRRGSERALIQARFRLPDSDSELLRLLEEVGGEIEESELLVSREIQANGRSRIRIGGVSASLKDLVAISRRLFDLHGQHAQQRLLSVTDHAALLSELARKAALAQETRQAVAQWKRLREEVRTLTQQAQEAERNREFLEFQFKELAQAQFTPGQEEELERKIKILSQAGQISQWIEQSRSSLADGGTLDRQLGVLSKALSKIAQADETQASLEDRLREARSHLSEIALSLDSYEVPDNADPAEVDRLNGKLAAIQKLKLRHRTDLPGLIELRDRLESQLRLADDSASEIAALQRQADAALERARQLGQELSAHQRTAATSLDTDITERLQALGMEGAAFRTRLEELPEPGPDGLLKAVFELSPNPGEGWRELTEVASGGEASRIMLAIESRLSAVDPVPLLVFDEVDAGLSGTVAHQVGRSLQELAHDRQVVAITHLHQVAALADQHLSIAKSVQDGRTHSQVRNLSRSDRLDELCRMLGKTDDPAVRAHAQSLLGGS